MTMTEPVLIAVDWGTSSFRAYLVAGDGAILARQSNASGILSVKDGAFAPVLIEAVAAWRSQHGALPILMSGMIGSRQGWREAPYLECPVRVEDVATRLLRFEADGIGALAIVPGLIDHHSGMPDVMRGEETQILGALTSSNSGRQTFVLPGTHAKWVTVEQGTISTFRTYMTGEVFAALKDHTILGRTMTDAPHDPKAFERGVGFGAAGGPPGDILNRIFSTRTLGLTGGLAPEAAASYLSGLLIGAEIASAAPRGAFTIIASDTLAARYEDAARHLGLEAHRAPADCVVAGLLAIANAAGLIGRST